MSNAPFHVYAKGLIALGAKLENVSSDALKCALLSSYTLGTTLSTGEFQSDIIVGGTGVEVANGAGYTTGGVALSSVTWAATVANSWSVSAAISTAYLVGAVVRPSAGNGFVYQCVVAGTSSGTAPTWPTVVGTTVADGGVTWLCIGSSVTVLGAAALVWTSTGAGFSAAFGLVYDSTPGTAGTNPIIGYFDLGGTLTASGGGTLTITPPTSGLIALGSS